MRGLLGFVLSPGMREVLGVVAILSTTAGVWLKLRLTAHLSDLEEAVKDGKLRPEQARQRARYVDLRASGLVTVGLVLLLVTAFGWSP